MITEERKREIRESALDYEDMLNDGEFPANETRELIGYIKELTSPEAPTVVAETRVAHPWQLCPKCFGDGHLGRHNSPPTMSTSLTPVCDLCNGNKVIAQGFRVLAEEDEKGDSKT